MTALVKLILALLAVIVLCLLFAGSVGYSDPLYYTYSYTPWVPWTPNIYVYYSQQPGWVPGHYYAPSTTTYNTTINNNPAPKAAPTRTNRVGSGLIGTPAPAGNAPAVSTPSKARVAPVAPTPVKARVAPPPPAAPRTLPDSKTRPLPPPPPKRKH